MKEVKANLVNLAYKNLVASPLKLREFLWSFQVFERVLGHVKWRRMWAQIKWDVDVD